MHVEQEASDKMCIDAIGDKPRYVIQPLDQQSSAILMEIIEDRHGKRPNIVTSEVLVSNWYEIISEQTIADAILDGIIHSAHRLEIQGYSMRKRNEQTNAENI